MNITHLMHPHQSPSIVKLNVEDFISIEDNPRQRDTPERAQKANKRNGHLYQPHPSHTVVSIALIVDEEEDTNLLQESDVKEMVISKTFDKRKIDGHTRSYLWDNGLLDAPDVVTCNVYFVSNIEQAKDFYRAYDSNKAVETGLDKLFSALRDAFGYPPLAPLWKKRGAKTAIEVAFNNNHSLNDDRMYSLSSTQPWTVEVLRFVDRETKLNIKMFNASVMAAMFVSILRDGSQAIDFWIKYSNGQGHVVAGELDAIMMASTYYDEIGYMGRADYTGHRPNVILVGTGRDVHNIYVPMFLYYYQAWKDSKKFTPRKKGNGYQRNLTSLTIDKFLGNKTVKEFMITAKVDL